MFIIKLTFLNILKITDNDNESGFTQDWASTAAQRTAARQVEVLANNAENPNRSTEYRTVTTTQPQPQFPEEDPEESKY